MTAQYDDTQQSTYTFRDGKILKALWRFFKPYQTKVILLIIADLFINAAFTVESLVLAYLTDILAGEIIVEDMYAACTFFILLDTVLVFGASIGAYFLTLSLKKTGQRIIYDIRNEMFRSIMALSTKQLRTLKIGSYVTRITNDTQTISLFFSDLLPQMFRSLSSLIIITILTFVYTGWYGFIFLAFLPIVFVLSYFFRKRSRRYYAIEKASVSNMNSYLSESFSGIKVTKIYANEEKRIKEFNEKNDSIFKSFMTNQNMFSLFYPMMYLLQIVCYLIIIAFGFPAVMAGTITIGNFQMLYSYSGQFFQPVQSLTQQLNTFSQIITSAERIQHVFEMIPEKEDVDEPVYKDTFEGKIEFRHVYFAYEGDDYVLKDVSFVILPGQEAAFVGATGAGKSTIISLITRIYEVNSGQILIDDVDINDYSIDCLRKNIGVMLQDVFLFSGTIYDNISLEDKSITNDEIVQACTDVGANTFIENLPNGYEERVTERGENFSAGQRQLISFARTLVYKPSLVLLDEATANIDTETEHVIQTSMEKIKRIGTTVIVAHRLSTIKNANIIFVVSKGEIVERGTHQELLALKGTYYNLYRLQNMQLTIDNKETMHE